MSDRDSDFREMTRITISLLIFLLSLPSPQLAGTCALYNSPTPGLHCLNGEEVDRAVTSSKTLWMVEFYSSWCGHCQHFAPVMKEMGAELETWSSVFRLGVLECTGSKANQKICDKFKVEAFPTIRFFKAHNRDPLKGSKVIVGARGKDVVLKTIINQIEESVSIPGLTPVRDADILAATEEDWTPLALVFEEANSYVGKKLVLDYLNAPKISVRRVLGSNSSLLKHYSVLELPSLVLEAIRGDYHVIAGHSFKDARAEFKKAIDKHLTALNTMKATPAKPSPAAAKLDDVAVKSYAPIKINRVHRADLLGAVSYAFRTEVPLHAIVSGSAFSALLRFTVLLEKAFAGPYPAASASLQEVRKQLEVKSSGGFITRRDWNRILDSKLGVKLFPATPQWSNCVGSLDRYRGYPCGMWMLIHTLTILTLPLPRSTPSQATPTSKEALRTVSAFIQNFFSCESCREHFTRMSSNITTKVHHDGDAILWLWETHNAVNERLQDALSSDPYYPKVIFPEAKTCPYCYQSVGGIALDHTQPNFGNTGFSNGENMIERTTRVGESLEHVWNRTAVLLYLWNFYHLNPHHKGESPPMTTPTSSDILKAAWPHKFADKAKLYHKYGLQRPLHHEHTLGFNGIDKGLCMMSYAMCFLFLGICGYWLFRRKRYRKFLKYP